MVRINGKETDAAGMTAEEYILRNGYVKSRVALEINGAILPKSRYGETVLADGDTVEIVSFVGGG